MARIGTYGVLGIVAAGTLFACGESSNGGRPGTGGGATTSTTSGGSAGAGTSGGAGGSGNGGLGGSGGSGGIITVPDASMPPPPPRDASTGVDAGSPIPPFTRNDCPGPLSATEVMALESTPTADAALRWLYPYDGTVWPRGILSPVLQWGVPASAGNALRVHIRGKHFEWKACVRPTAAGQFEMPQDVWEQLNVSNEGSTDSITVEIVHLANGRAVGPITQKWNFANAKMKGAIFYGSYNSALAAAQGIQGGVVLRLLPGARAPEIFLSRPPAIGGECVGCHALSANGSRLVADIHAGGGLTFVGSAIYGLTPTSTPNPPAIQTKIPQSSFSAFTPDGAFFVTHAAPSAGGPFVVGNIPGTWGVGISELIRSDTGEIMASSGMVGKAMMPSFSADGRKIVFTDFGIGSGKGLATMDFDPATAKFTNYKSIYTHATQYTGWPFFLPDGNGVVFALGTADNFASSFGSPLQPQNSDLYFIDLAHNSKVTPLATLNGFRDVNQTQPYLPAGERDLHKNFFPTGVPVAAGGQFWMFFTSRRTYGNLKAGLLDAPDSKQLWVAALKIGGEDDISYPPFYLRGQELQSGNVRAFAALEPCKADGMSCETGIDCCGRFCTDKVCAPPKGCAKIDEGCKTVADCCLPPGNEQVQCIAGFCAILRIPPPK
jgi:hypothetical protein